MNMRIDITNEDFKILQNTNKNLSNSRIKQVIRREQSFVWIHLLNEIKQEE